MSFATKGDTTFLEAYKRTGRIFCVSAVSDNHRPILLNYRTAPHIVIWSAVIASASLPMLMAPSPLIRKKKNGKLVEFTSYGRVYCDGSIQFDVPTQRLLEHFNVKFNVAVQCNPHINAFYYNTRGTANSPVNHWGNSGMRGGFLSSLLEKLLKLEMRKWMRLLSDMDLLPQMFGHDWRNTIHQQTRGQITMNPKPPLRNYFLLINDPSLSRMTEYFKTGQSMAFPYLCMIKTRMRLQNCLRNHISNLDPTKDNSLLNRLLNEGSVHHTVEQESDDSKSKFKFKLLKKQLSENDADRIEAKHDKLIEILHRNLQNSKDFGDLNLITQGDGGMNDNDEKEIDEETLGFFQRMMQFSKLNRRNGYKNGYNKNHRRYSL